MLVLDARLDVSRANDLGDVEHSRNTSFLGLERDGGGAVGDSYDGNLKRYRNARHCKASIRMNDGICISLCFIRCSVVRVS